MPRPGRQEGGLDLSDLQFDPADPTLFARWVAVHDRVRNGEMPPRDAEPPDPAARRAFQKGLGDLLAGADRERARASGRAAWRRLNRYEYENTVRDLLDAPWLQLRDRLPEDGTAHRFNKSGEALDVSHIQMARYLGTVRYYAREQRNLVNKMKFGPFNRSAERATFPLLDWTAQPEVIEEKAPVTVGDSDPEKREHEAIGVVAGCSERGLEGPNDRAGGHHGRPPPASVGRWRASTSTPSRASTNWTSGSRKTR